MTQSPRTALVTGAASGIGRLTALRLASQYVKVAALDANQQGLEELQKESLGIRPWVCDVSNSGAVGRVVKEVETKLGDIDRVVNSAGVLTSSLLVDQNADEIQHVMRVNFGGVVNICHAVMPGMLSRGRGQIVNMASIMGWVPTFHFGAYSASKFAVVAFSEVLHHELLRTGIQVLCICPPVVSTPMLENLQSDSRVFDQARRSWCVKPAVVVDAIEKGLKKNQPMVFPGRQAGLLWRLRRLVPKSCWKHFKNIEKL